MLRVTRRIIVNQRYTVIKVTVLAGMLVPQFYFSKSVCLADSGIRNYSQRVERVTRLGRSGRIGASEKPLKNRGQSVMHRLRGTVLFQPPNDAYKFNGKRRNN